MSDEDSIPTRQSLLARLKGCDNDASWQEFFDTYWRLIHATALKAGLREQEAQEVVQEVMIASSKKMPLFTYTPGKDSLKGWLLGVTRWKVADQYRKREAQAMIAGEVPASDSRVTIGVHDPARTATVERVPDPGCLDDLWDAEWRQNLLRTALNRVKVRVNPAHYEMYHLHVVQGLTVRDTARALSTNSAAVYLAKHRVGKLIRCELERLRVAGKAPTGI